MTLVERLRAVESDPIGAGLANNRYRNPDGPEAADRIEALEAELARVRVETVEDGGAVTLKLTGPRAREVANKVVQMVRQPLPADDGFANPSPAPLDSHEDTPGKWSPPSGL